MKVGGNGKAKQFFDSQPDIKPGMSLQQKYNTKAAALYRDKVNTKTFFYLKIHKLVLNINFLFQIATEAAGKPWSEASSSASNFQSTSLSNNASSSSLGYNNNRSSASLSNNPSSSAFYDEPQSNSYQSGYGGMSATEIKSQTADYFSKRQAENASRPE